MSSIYRKGRDGYFYYQTYVYNNETGKKDRRVYHALNTKSRDEAVKKKGEYDKKYQGKNVETTRFPKKLVLTGLIFFTILIIMFSPNKENIGSDENIASSERKLESLKSTKLTNTVVLEDTSLLTDNNLKIIKADKDALTFEKIQDNSVRSDSKNKIKIKSKQKNSSLRAIKNSIDEEEKKSIRLVDMKYKVHRLERISNNFKQGKIYLTVEDKYNDDLLKKLCQKIRNQHTEFSNIIICIYSDTDEGISIAKGIQDKINSKAQIENWLVMYSYNSVEGEYYDNNPGGYLGGS